MSAAAIRKELRKLASPAHAQILQRFFKTAPGEYGAGDIFLGLRMPQIRSVCKSYTHLSFHDLKVLINSKYHEERMTALLILAARYKKASAAEQKDIFNFYIGNKNYINNWDLVDLSAPGVIGAHLIDKDHNLLYELALSDNLWDRRIAVLSTFYFIKQGIFSPTLKICEMLLKDSHDLIHKATGWMLREIGKRDLEAEEDFLQEFAAVMPRTMLRYAIEKFPQQKRLYYLHNSKLGESSLK